MTREEQILSAAREYNSGVTLSSPSNVLHFEAGAKWADEHPDLSSLWHDPSEEPQGYEWEIICQNNLGKFPKMTSEEISIYYPNSGWKGFINLERITRWAYIDDLLPKGCRQ